MTRADVEKLIAKYERKLKKEYQRGFEDGVREEARIKRVVKYICKCGNEMHIKRLVD